MNVKVFEVGGVVGRGEAVPDGPVVVGVLVGGRHAQDVSHDVGVLFHVLHVFLQQAMLVPVSRKQEVVFVRSAFWRIFQEHLHI